MARYTGPKTKIARKFGEPIFGEDKILSRRNFPPGQHGQNRRRKTSEYGIQLREKQKAKYTYGVLERQFRNLFEKASGMKGITGEILLQLLEGRLDNVVYRLGIAKTRAAARQLVLHEMIRLFCMFRPKTIYSTRPTTGTTSSTVTHASDFTGLRFSLTTTAMMPRIVKA